MDHDLTEPPTRRGSAIVSGLDQHEVTAEGQLDEHGDDADEQLVAGAMIALGSKFHERQYVEQRR